MLRCGFRLSQERDRSEWQRSVGQLSAQWPIRHGGQDIGKLPEGPRKLQFAFVKNVPEPEGLCATLWGLTGPGFHRNCFLSDESVCSFYYVSSEGKDALWGLTALWVGRGGEIGSFPESLWLEIRFCSLEVRLSKLRVST